MKKIALIFMLIALGGCNWLDVSHWSNRDFVLTIEFQSEAGDHLFAFRCPWPEDVEAYQIIQALMELMESSFETELVKDYLTELRRYF